MLATSAVAAETRREAAGRRIFALFLWRRDLRLPKRMDLPFCASPVREEKRK